MHLSAGKSLMLRVGENRLKLCEEQTVKISDCFA